MNSDDRNLYPCKLLGQTYQVAICISRTAWK